MKKLTVLEKTLTALGVIFTVLPVALAAFYYDAYRVFPLTDVLIILSYVLDAAILIFVFCKLISSMNSERFRTQILVPAAVVAVFGVLSLTLISDIDLTVTKNRFESQRNEYAAAVEYLDSQQYSEQMELPDELAHLSLDGKVMAFSCQDGKYICYFFIKLDHPNRYEGVLYVAGSSPVLYSDITKNFKAYSYDELLTNYVLICFNK